MLQPPSLFNSIVLCQKIDTMTRDEFVQYAKKVHVPLVLAMPGIRHYQANFMLASDEALPYDGVIHLWFDSAEDLEKAYASPEGRKALADAPACVKMPTTSIPVTENWLINEVQHNRMFKAIFLASRKEGMSMEAFREYQMNIHVPLVLKIPGMRGYKVDFARHQPEPAPYDAVISLWFNSSDDFQTGMSSPEAQHAIADQSNFLDSQAVMLLCEEYHVEDPRDFLNSQQEASA
jgi:uncharacterized protein (TIGR02118 family)